MNDIFMMDKDELQTYMKSKEFDMFFTHTRSKHINKGEAYLKGRIIGDGKTISSSFVGNEKQIFALIKKALTLNISSLHKWLHTEDTTYKVSVKLKEPIEATICFLEHSSIKVLYSTKSFLIIINKKNIRNQKLIKITAYPT